MHVRRRAALEDFEGRGMLPVGMVVGHNVEKQNVDKRKIGKRKKIPPSGLDPAIF